MEVTLDELKFGDTVWAISNPGFGHRNPHPILFVKAVDGDYFEGFALTTKGPEEYKNNIELERKYLTILENETTHPPCFILESRSFLKKSEWGDFNKIAELNSDGVKFIKTSDRRR